MVNNGLWIGKDIHYSLKDCIRSLKKYILLHDTVQDSLCSKKIQAKINEWV